MTEFAGTSSLTVSRHELLAMNAIGAKSFCGSYSICLFKAGSITSAELENRSVYPSGGELAAAFDPIVMPPPGLLSMTTGWLRVTCSCCATSRAKTSFGDPGV